MATVYLNNNDYSNYSVINDVVSRDAFNQELNRIERKIKKQQRYIQKANWKNSRYRRKH